MAIPTIISTETSQKQVSRGTGADQILVIGKSPLTADPDKIYKFTSPAEAMATVENGGIGPVAEGNELLAAVLDIFEEGAATDAKDELGIDVVYAINVGATPTTQNYTDALEASTILKNVKIELMAQCSDLAVAAVSDAHITILKGRGERRHAIFTNAEGATIADMVKMTLDTETSYIRSKRVLIKENPALQAKFAAKMACTPYYLDPARGAYRTVSPSDINLYKDSQCDTLVEAGIIPDWMHRSPYETSDKAEPVRAVSTAYRLDDGAREVDSNVHQRRNMDYQMRTAELIAAAEFKNNKTDTGLDTIEQSIISAMQKEASKGYIVPKKTEPTDAGFDVSVTSHPTEAETIVLKLSARLVNAIYELDDEADIKTSI